ncbi:unnamed protein product, partial [Callosobruchus maculatus]
MVDLGGYVIILVETKDKKIKLYGSPADKDNLEVGDEILEVNGKTLEDATHTEVINHIHQCIRSRTICLRVKRRSGARLAVDLDLCSSSVQDAFVIAVEQQARERLERLSALKRITPVDMTKLSQQLNQASSTTPNAVSTDDLNGFIKSSPIYVTSLTATSAATPANATAPHQANKQPVSATSEGQLAPPTAVIACDRSLLPNGHAHEPQQKAATGSVTAASQLANDVRAATAAQQPQIQHQQGDPNKNKESPPQANRKPGDRRGSSPFQNGRTELLIGAEDNKLKTTAIVETNNNKLSIDTDNRPRRRSGSSIVVLDGGCCEEDLQEPVKKHLQADDTELDDMVMMLSAGGGGGGSTDGPHREMAVDVPDTFVARNKTPPRYPPPKAILQSGVNGAPPTIPATPTPPLPTLNDTSAGVTKPVPPPRDHLKIEKDGRLVNRAPAPQLPARLNSSSGAVPQTPVTPPVAHQEPTKEQLDSIKKYQEQIRKRKEEEDRLAAQTEFLNRSLRGSRKLQALESRPQGAVNDAFAGDDSEETNTDAETIGDVSSTEGKEQVHIQYVYGDLVSAVQRLQLQLKKAACAAGSTGVLGGLEGRIAAVQSLVLSPQFGRALAVHNRVQAARRRAAAAARQPHADAQRALRECLDAVAGSQSACAVELAALLTGYEFEALMVAHDGVSSMLPLDSACSTPTTTESLPTAVTNRCYGEENIKVIKIEKSTEPLGATVKNEGDAVVIGRIIRGGAADKSGLLHEGDEILEVNGIEMRGKSINAVCDILQTMEGTLTFLIVPAAQTRHFSNRDSFLHVRAHFDYDPEEDMYIPCRELGISFQKGDVLHIISQEDPNWWQAYREGEEDQTLAGLVPSQSFQYQRESMRLAAEERMTKPQRKSTTLLCGKTNKRKKKKGIYADGGYPMYSNTVDEYDPEEILTYEEV